MKKISFNIPSGQLLSILKGDATRFVDYTTKAQPTYHIGEQLQINPEQVKRIIENRVILHSIPFRAGYLNNYNDIFSFDPETFFMLEITNICRVRFTEFTLIDTLRLGVKTCPINDCNAYMIPNFSNYTGVVFSSSECALQAMLQQICPLATEITASNPTYNLYEFTIHINPEIEECTEYSE